MTSTEDLLSLLDAVVYADAFDTAVTLDELHRFARLRIARDEIAAILRDDPVLCEVVAEQAGLFSLRDSRGAGAGRPRRAQRAHRLAQRAQRVARVIRHVPFVRGIVLTGSTAADDAPPGADADLLVLVQPGRLATVFLVLGSASSLTRRRLFCPNFYLRDDRLGISTESSYVARELAQARTLVGDALALRAANAWLGNVFPNLPEPDLGAAVAAGSGLQRLLEKPLRGGRGDALERWAAGVVRSRLCAHYGGAVPEDVARAFESGHSLRFHGSGVADTTQSRYASRRADLASRLAHARSQDPGQAGRSS